MHAPGRRPAHALATAAALAACAAYALATAADTRAQSPGADGRIHLTVDDVRDLPDARPGDGVCASPAPDERCTLRAAFEEAGASLRPTTIALPAGTYTLTHGVVPPQSTAATVALDVPANADIRLEGVGAATSTIVVLAEAGVPVRLHVRVEPRAALAIHGVTLRGGRAAGGVAVLGRVSLHDVVLAGCQTDGSVVHVADTASLTTVRTVIADNRAYMGLAIWGTSTILSSTVQGNIFEADAIYVTGAVRLEDSAIVQNTAGSVAGGRGEFRLDQSTVADNVVRRSYGGATILDAGSLALEHATVAGNRAPARFGRLLVARVRHLTIAGSIFAENGTQGAVFAPAAGCEAESVESHGDSILEQPSCGDPSVGDRVTVDADLGPLVDAGGPTPVRLPRPGSPAIGARTAGCPAVDARGAPRPVGGPCAAGAAEPSAPPPASGLLWPIEPAFPTGGPDAPRRVDGVPGPSTVLAVRGGRGIVARGLQAQAIVANGGPFAVDGGLVDLPAPVIDAAMDGTTAWLLHAEGMLTAVDVADRVHPVRLAVALQRVPVTPDDAKHYVRIAVPAPGVLWQFGWTSGYRGSPEMAVTVWDVGQPATPRLLFSVPIGGAVDLAWTDRRIVTLRNFNRSISLGVERSLAVFDATQLVPGMQGGTLALDGTPSRIALRGDHAFVVVRQRDGGAPDGMLVIDIRDAAKPAAVGWWPEDTFFDPGTTAGWGDILVAPDGVLLHAAAMFATADLSDPLRPRILRRTHFAARVDTLRATDTGILARLSDGRDVAIDLGDPRGPQLVHAPSDGAPVVAVAGAGEHLVWRAQDAYRSREWVAVEPHAPAVEVGHLPTFTAAIVPVTSTAMVAVADGVAWMASPEGIAGVELHGIGAFGSAYTTLDERCVVAVAASNGRLWLLTPTRLSLWDVGDPARPVERHAWSSSTESTLRGLSADEGGAVLWSADGRIVRLRHDDHGPSLPLPLVVRSPGGIVGAAIVGDRLAVVDGSQLTAYAIDGDTARDLGALPVPGIGRGLAVSGERAYVVAGGWLNVVGVSGDAVVPIAKVPAPGALGPLAIAGGRAFAAAGASGLLAYDLPAPAPPTVLLRCGETWPGERDVTVRAPGATAVSLRLDGHAVASGVPGPSRDRTDLATLRVTLPAGPHRLDAVARRPESPPRTGPVVRIKGDATLLFDPIGVTFDDGRHSDPRPALNAIGCATLADGWTVRIDARAAIVVVVPVRSDIAATAAVTVTLASRTARLAPRPDTPSLFTGTLPPITGPTGDAIVHIEVVAGTERATWHGRAAREQLWLPWAGR
ncbi:MAG: hypothetical protein IT332_07080 [Ardenticatenales bacterium]|nr:hypothetical protein [Ardenticatenales bacterium]